MSPLVPNALRKRPMAPVAALLLGGIVAGRRFEWEWQSCALAAAICLGPVCFRLTRWLALAIFLFALGGALYSARYRIASGDDLRVVLGTTPHLGSVRGEILETPAPRQTVTGEGELIYSHAIIEVTELRLEQDWVKASGKMAARVRGELGPEFFQKRRVEVTGVLDLPPKAAAPGLFDYRAYLYNSRIFYQIKSDSAEDWILLSREPMPLTERFRRWARLQLQRGLPPDDEPVRIMQAMTLGQTSNLSPELTEQFMATGTLHIIAISGLHVACIAGYFYFVVVTVCGLPRGLGGLLVVAVVWFYTVATWSQSSAVRSALMVSAFMGGWLFKRPSDLLNTVMAAGTLLVLAAPEQVFQTGFQLTFSVVAVIALVLLLLERHHPGILTRIQEKLLNIDPLLVAEAVPRWKKLLGSALAVVIGNFVISAAAWLGSIPISACYFQNFSPVSLVANLLAVPLSSVALISTAISLLVPPLGPLCNYVSWAFITYTIQWTRLCEALPFGFFRVPPPGAAFILFYYSALAMVLIPPLRARGWRPASFLVVGGLGIFWAAPVFASSPLAKITVLPCAGTPAFVDRSGRANDLLIDCSSERDAEFMVKRFLRAHGFSSLPNLILSHGDVQSVGGFTTIWNEFNPAMVFTSGARMRSPGYRQAIQFLGTQREHWTQLSRGDTAAGWRVLHPGKGRGFPRGDDNSLVLSTAAGPWRILHLSDLGTLGQRQLLASGLDLRADVVIAGMPERDEPLLGALLEAIHPQIIVLGTTRYPYTAAGSPALRARLERSGASVFSTSEQDAVTILFAQDRCTVSGMNGQSAVLSQPAPRRLAVRR